MDGVGEEVFKVYNIPLFETYWFIIRQAKTDDDTKLLEGCVCVCVCVWERERERERERDRERERERERDFLSTLSSSLDFLWKEKFEDPNQKPLAWQQLDVTDCKTQMNFHFEYGFSHIHPIISTIGLYSFQIFTTYPGQRILIPCLLGGIISLKMNETFTLIGFIIHYHIYQPLRSDRIWHKVKFLSGG